MVEVYIMVREGTKIWGKVFFVEVGEVSVVRVE